MMFKPIARYLSAILLSALIILIAACNSTNSDENPASNTSNSDQSIVSSPSDSDEGADSKTDLQLRRFNHCDELKAYLVNTNQKQNSLFDYVHSWNTALPVTAVQDTLEVSTEAATDSESGLVSIPPLIDSVTGTNNQVFGVDEADFIKTNGQYTYLLSGGYLMILQTWPADQSQELSRTKIDGVPRALLFHGDVVWVVSDMPQQNQTQVEVSLAAGFVPRVNQVTKVTLLQVTNPQQPELIRETVIESRYVDARRIDQQVYLIVSAQLNLNTVLENPENVTLDELIPNLIDNKIPSVSTQATSSTICGCDAIYRPEIPNGTGTTTILSFDLENPLSDIPSQTVLGNSAMVYANEENLYIASTEDQYWLWSPVMEGEQEVPTPSTIIHKFSLQSSPQYLASGRVDGHLLNQFAMDEYQGLLRLVTTEQSWWNTNGPENRLYVMEQTGDQLLQRAQLNGLGKPGESVYAVRFDQEKGYLVTFERIDPLITLDLSDASNPVVAGELEVPGFSTYLHPINGDMIIAIGQDTGTNGIKLSLFDISDFSQPALLSDHLIGAGSHSEAAYNHHAFNWFEQEQMLAIPVMHWNSRPPGTDHNVDEIFNGLELFKVTAQEGFQPYAAIDHDIFYQDQNGLNWFYPEAIRRSFFVTDVALKSYIYSVSGRGLMVNDLASPDINLAEITLPSDIGKDYHFQTGIIAD